MKIGVVDVGGGLRDIYGAGVFDFCMDNGVNFDTCAGVSAGSANVTSYMAGQRGRNYSFYTEYAFRREYMSVSNWLRSRNYVDLDYIYGTLSNSDGENPLDFKAVLSSGKELYIVATNALTGKPHYFSIDDMKQDDYAPVKASSCVPVVNRPYYINGTAFYDGGMSDPVPFRKCFECGCGKVVLILTRPKDYRRSPGKDSFAVKRLGKSFPEAAKAMQQRAQTYNEELDLAAEYEKQGKVLIIAPDDIGKLKTLSKDLESMKVLYQKGYNDAGAVLDFIRD